MALEIKPTAQALTINYIVTLGILGAIVFISWKKPNPGKYYYSTDFNDHEGHGYESTACGSCHTKSFSEVTNTDCSNSGCHQKYTPEYTKVDSVAVYGEGWQQIAAENPGILVKARKEHASVVYHKIGWLQGKDCTTCHITHTPPVDGKPLTFSHKPDDLMFPADGKIAQCAQCHTATEAPPIIAHADMLAGKAADCWDCHLSSNSWTEKIEWTSRPANLTDADGRKPLEVAAQIMASATPAQATPVPEPTQVVAETPAPTPEPVETAAATPPPTPAPEVATAEWIDYTPQTDLRTAGVPTLLFFVDASEASARLDTFLRELPASPGIRRVRVDAVAHSDLLRSYRLASAPALVQLDAEGKLDQWYIPRTEFTAADVQAFLEGK